MKFTELFAVLDAISLIDKKDFDNESVKKEIIDLVKNKGFDYDKNLWGGNPPSKGLTKNYNLL